MPSDVGYSNGFGRYLQSAPYTIQVLPNSAYLRFRVSASHVTVDYVRVNLTGDGSSGKVAYTYTIGAGVHPGAELNDAFQVRFDDLFAQQATVTDDTPRHHVPMFFRFE